MDVIGQAKQVTVFIGESDKWGRKPLHMAILEMLKAEGCAGATVSRALAGFGAHSHIKTAGLVALSADLPLMIQWVDNPARIERVLPKLRKMVKEGLITAQNVDVLFYSHRALLHLSAFVPVQDIMSTTLHTVTTDTPLAAAVTLLLDKVLKTLPVIDAEGYLVGILTDGDLLKKVKMMATSAQRQLSQSEMDAELQRLRDLEQTVQDVMTPNPVTVLTGTTLPKVVELMLEHNIKRLPVVDERGKLIGMVSRIDVLRAFSQPLTTEIPRQTAETAGRRGQVQEIMITNVSAVHVDAPLDKIVPRLVSGFQRRVVVINDHRHAVGIITDGDLINRATPTERSGLIHSLTHRLPVGETENYHLSERTAAQVMTTPVVTVTPNTSLVDALQLLLTHQIKRLPVIDDQQQLVGLIGRGGILQALGKQ